MSTHPLAIEAQELDGALLRRFAELEEKLRRQRPEDDVELLREAYHFAAERHAGQTRKTGEPFLAHPLEVAHILADMRLDAVCLAIGLLHDTVEDTDAKTEQIRALFGDEIARCVDGVTKLGRIHYDSDEDRQAETYRKMLLAMIADIRVILVKLADRLHNMRTLGPLKPEKRQRIARETLEIYAPIALRLGMGKIRGELEDLAFSYLEPEGYQQVMRFIESRREASQAFVETVRSTLASALAEAEIPAEVEGRIKRPYSIWRKLQRQKITFDQVYDLLAFRVITDSKKSCYAALGIIHDKWRPIPDRFKDFVAMPRPNLYQSLHTSLITDDGRRFEVQIRTREMHQMAEEGICAHWKYKEGHAGPDVDDRRISWLRQLVEWQQDLQDPGSFLSTLKIDLYPEEVYVFTPKGKLIVLPRDATPVDFAYSIHTEVGNTCVGAKVDGRIVPLRYKLTNGDLVEIITQKGRQPSADWLSFVKTSRARHKIRASLNARRRDRAEEIGERLLDREAKRLKLPLGRLRSPEMAAIARGLGCSQLSDLYVQVGYGRYSARQIVAKLAEALGEHVAPAAEPASREGEEEPRRRPAPPSGGQAVLAVKGVDDILVYRARCCNPIAGEPIVGYITRGKGVAVHARGCPNVQNLMYEDERRIDVEWQEQEGVTFTTRLAIYVEDRPNILNDITSILKNEEVNITAVESRSGKGADRPAWINITIELSNAGQLDRIVSQIRGLPYVREVSRGVRL